MVLSNVLEVKNKNGLHTRPAGVLCQITTKTKYDNIGIFLLLNDMRVDAKSILNVLALGAIPGSKVILEVEGEEPDKTTMEEAMEEISDFFDKEFFQVDADHDTDGDKPVADY